MFDVRKLCDNFKEIHSRYYVDTNGTFYTSLSPNTNKIMVDGARYNIRSWRNTLITQLNKSNKQIIQLPIPNSNKYFLMYDGTILQKLYTRIHDNKRITVCLMRVQNNGGGNHYEVHRLLAGTFIGDITGMEVHHIDGNCQNNNLNNLEIITFEDHRSVNGIHNNKVL